RYLLTITVINFSLGVVIGLTMFMLGLPNPVLIGVGAFLLNFVPYVGALVGALATAAIALLTFDWYGWAMIAGGTYVLINSIEGQLVTPYFEAILRVRSCILHSLQKIHCSSASCLFGGVIR
ncbi:AI-2E family transporter, partial [Salinisphaera orenii]|uniref:AI-2E family transporter n=1 Tax=Salinisphaera orenii TaxID=856731 RepID=UPI000F46B091